MDQLREILSLLRSGELSEEEAAARIGALTRGEHLERVDRLAQLDVFRERRAGVPEVVFAQTKPPKVTVKIVDALLERKGLAFATRVSEATFQALRDKYSGEPEVEIEEHELARAVVVRKKGIELPTGLGRVGVVSAGTSDLPVAEEARVTARVLGCEVLTSYDVGIAGFHRIFEPLRRMLQADASAMVVVAGMEGTLPGVVASLVDVPVVGVPTSTGYGFGGGGVGALTTMLQCCVPGLVVVNVDNGFGAGAAAALIARQAAKGTK
ncbi:MAG: nickel pincer cofactor biosynthesis protein LarB [Promethearchaeota archaeon]